MYCIFYKQGMIQAGFIVFFAFFLQKIAEFAIILELNGYSDCLKIR